jgi:hypothetical protein
MSAKQLQVFPPYVQAAGTVHGAPTHVPLGSADGQAWQAWQCQTPLQAQLLLS